MKEQRDFVLDKLAAELVRIAAVTNATRDDPRPKKGRAHRLGPSAMSSGGIVLLESLAGFHG